MNLYTDVHGANSTGEPVLMIHGLGGTCNVWAAQAGVLSRFFPVYCPDNRSSGRSPVADSVNIISMVNDLVELLDHHQLTAVHVVGHSLGSVVAQWLAVMHPARVRDLSLVGPIQSPAEATRNALRERAAKARADGLVGIANLTVQVGTSALTKALKPEVAGFVREMVMAQPTEGYAQNCEAIAGIEAAPIDTLSCPTLVITGDEDNTSPPAVARALSRKMPKAQFHLVARCGHWMPIEQAEVLSRILLDFILGNSVH
jgi:3-oxoadipate enol-lactonase